MIPAYLWTTPNGYKITIAKVERNVARPAATRALAVLPS